MLSNVFFKNGFQVFIPIFLTTAFINSSAIFSNIFETIHLKILTLIIVGTQMTTFRNCIFETRSQLRQKSQQFVNIILLNHKILGKYVSRLARF